MKEKSVWENFKEEIMFKNRFLFNKSENVEKVNQLLEKCKFSSVMSYINNPSDRLYRVRPGIVNEVGMPPIGVTKDGRFNACGISYFYCSENIETCIFEAIKEPKIRDKFTIGEFSAKENEIIMDFYVTNSVQKYMPFFPRINSSEFMLLSEIIIDLSKGYDSSNSINYVPTQYIFEYINNYIDVKVDGLLYSSSFGTGKNYVFRSDDNFNLESIRHGEIVECDIERRIVYYKIID